MTEKSSKSCWHTGCEKPHVARVKMDFVGKKTKYNLEGKFCAEHFESAWNSDNLSFKEMAEIFIKNSKEPE
jgi:hypothetical protein